ETEKMPDNGLSSAKIIQPALSGKFFCLRRCSVCVPSAKCGPGAKPGWVRFYARRASEGAGAKKWRTAPLRSAKKQGMDVKLVN
ncbi:hypothetical protein, partial [uncultured Alistipes sp.]|uniref:hypothetical protein n=1 Tax=uncultured Alistipes sp. TaxID=538949 RepID=UPI00258319F1